MEMFAEVYPSSHRVSLVENLLRYKYCIASPFFLFDSQNWFTNKQLLTNVLANTVWIYHNVSRKLNVPALLNIRDGLVFLV